MSVMESFMSELGWWKKWSKKTGDYTAYRKVLRECHAEFVKVYSQMKSTEGKSLLESILKFMTCEIKENSIKCNKAK